MSNQSLELFDSKGHFVMPSAEAIATLDAGTQERFRAVQAAALASESATAATKAATAAVVQAMDAARRADDRLRQVRPPVTQVQAAKEWIAGQRALSR